VRPTLALRLLGLAALALVAGVIALAVTRNGDEGEVTAALPEPAPAPGGGWYTALAGPAPAPRKPRRTACGALLGKDTLGVSHPVLPCNVKIFIEYSGKRVLTQVIDRGPAGAGREFDLTKALADKVGLHGLQTVKWRYAVASDD
jgi:peptidoglycan lytic transglycosylase